MSGDRRHDPEGGLALLLVALMVPAWWFSSLFGKEVLTEIAIFAILAMSLGFLVGRVGLVSLGHAAFFAVGSYLFAGATVFLGWSAAAAALAAVALSALAALVVGFFVVRLAGVFFIMVTLAVGQMAHAFFLGSRAFNADDGMAGVPRMDLSWMGLEANDSAVFSAVALAAAALVLGLLWLLARSPFGHTLAALRQNEQRLRSLGCPVFRYKLAAFTLAGAVGGGAGVIGAQHLGFVSPDISLWTVSGEILIMVIIGGMGSLPGAALGAALVILLRHYLAGLSDYWGFFMGLFFILVVLFAGDGVYGRCLALWRLWSRRTAKG